MPIDDVASIFDSVGIDTGFFLSEEPSEYVPETETVDNFFTTVFFQVFLVTSTVVLILGTLILSRKRTFYEALFLFLAFIIPKRRKYWGTVFDDTSKKPIPFSLVRVIKAFEEEKKDVFVTDTITDLDGKYRIILEKNEPGLNLWANATGFVPYTKDILFTGDLELEIVEDLRWDWAASSWARRFPSSPLALAARCLCWDEWAVAAGCRGGNVGFHVQPLAGDHEREEVGRLLSP